MATAAAVNEEPATTRFAKDQLKAFVERVERLEEEKKTISDDIRDVYAEAKGNGLDVKALRTIVRMRKLGRRRAQGAQAILEPICMRSECCDGRRGGPEGCSASRENPTCRGSAPTDPRRLES